MSEIITRVPLKHIEFLAVDVETSSLSMNSRVVEIGAVRFTLNGIIEEFQTLVNPREPIAPEASKIHGITDQMVRFSPGIEDVLPGLFNLMRGAVFVAHNAYFDAKMLSGEMSRLNIKLPEWPVFCTLRFARKIFPGLKSYSLGSLAIYLGIETETLHNALPDAKAAGEVLIKGLKRLKEDAVLVDIPGYLGTLSAVAPPRLTKVPTTGGLTELYECSRMRIPLEIVISTEPWPLVVTPLQIMKNGGKLFLSAYCHREGIERVFPCEAIVNFRQV